MSDNDAYDRAVNLLRAYEHSPRGGMLPGFTGDLRDLIIAEIEGYAESALAVAHSEIVTLVGENLQMRRALEKIAVREPYQHCHDCNITHQETNRVLTATPHAAALGTLVEAALPVVEAEKRYRTSKRNGERDEALAQLHECHDRLIAAADALAAMGKEGASNA